MRRQDISRLIAFMAGEVELIVNAPVSAPMLSPTIFAPVVAIVSPKVTATKKRVRYSKDVCPLQQPSVAWIILRLCSLKVKWVYLEGLPLIHSIPPPPHGEASNEISGISDELNRARLSAMIRLSATAPKSALLKASDISVHMYFHCHREPSYMYKSVRRTWCL